MNGEQAYKINELHRRYGQVVRTAPDELSFASPAAWRDIYGHRIGAASGIPEVPKHEKFYRAGAVSAHSIINAPRELHSILRRGLAHGFSEKSMREQESMIGGYVDLLISRLREQTAGGDSVNIVKWYTFTTFDIIGDLTVGSPFNCLESSEYHPWVKLFGASGPSVSYRFALQVLGLGWLSRKLAGLISKSRMQHIALTKEWVLKRMEDKEERPDLMEGLLKKREKGYGFPEIHMTASTLLIAGSGECPFP